MREAVAAEALSTERLDLEPVQVHHAAEAAALFDDARLHVFTGGAPATEEQLRRRYAFLAAGRSPDGRESWLNWLLRRSDGQQLIGTVQASVRDGPAGSVAELAWVVGSEHQGVGYAREAALAVAAWLRGRGVVAFTAHIHPDHRASIAVARAVGMTPTDDVVDGEVRWTSA